MHIPDSPCQGPIVALDLTCDERLRLLLLRLAPDRWPLPLERLPAGTALVGGAVRDALLDRLADRPDLDLVIPTGAISLARSLAQDLGGTCVVLDSQRDIARLVIKGWTLDLAAQEGPCLEADLRRRDYTANAIALILGEQGSLIDPTGGLADLGAGRLVAVSETNLLDDPLRLLRGLRLSSELAMALEPDTLAWLQRHAAALAHVAGERVLAELEKLAASPTGHLHLAWALEHGLLSCWGARPDAGSLLRELSEDRTRATGLTSHESAWALPLARLATLLSAEAMERLRSSRRLQQRCARLRCWWARVQSSHELEGLAESERWRLHHELEEDLPAFLIQLDPGTSQAAMTRWRDTSDPLFHPRSPLDGRQLQHALGITPGPELGQLLRHLSEERAFGRIPLAEPASGAVAVATAKAWWRQRHDLLSEAKT